MMTALIVYLGAGAIVLIAALTQHIWKRQPSSDLAEAVMDAMHPERQRWHKRILRVVIVPALTGLLVVLVWPAALVIWRRGAREEAELREVPPPREFSVSPSDLRERMSLDEAEARERVLDPLHAVPDLPFGHLNSVWQKLRASWQEGDELWFFSVEWQDQWGERELRTGYVLWREGEPAGHILTMLKALEEHPVVQKVLGSNADRTSESLDQIEIPAFLRKQAD